MADLQRPQDKLDDKPELKEESEQPKTYRPILQAPLTNQLFEIDAKQAEEVDVLDIKTGLPTGEKRRRVYPIKDSESYIELSLDNGKLTGRIQQVIDYSVQMLSACLPHYDYENDLSIPGNIARINDARKVSFSVDDFMRVRNIKDKKDARKQLKDGLSYIYGVSIDGTEIRYERANNGRKKAIKKHFKMRLLDTLAVFKYGGIVEAIFAMTLAEYLSTAYIMALPIGLFQINTSQHRYAYSIGRYIAVHHNRNMTKLNENYIKVETLLKACNFNMRDRHITDSIEIFERNLDALTETNPPVIKRWEYCHENGAPLTKQEIAAEKKKAPSYDEFKSRFIKFEGIDEIPGRREKLLADKKARKTKATKLQKETQSKLLKSNNA